MIRELELLRIKVIELVKKTEAEPWVYVRIKFNFPPFINKGYNGIFLFENAEKEILPIFLPFDLDLQNKILNLIFKYNQDNEYNTIVFEAKREEIENATIDISFEQEVDSVFQNNLPKSKRGKTVPWWKNPDETKDMIS